MIQSTTSTAGLITFAAANEEFKSLVGKSLCSVFDSAEFEVPLNRAAVAAEMIFYYFDDWPVKTFDWLDLPIGCEVEVSNHSWGRCETIHRGSTQAQIEEILAKIPQH